MAKGAVDVFVRRTITLPTGVFDYAVQQSRSPRHANNLSAYVRTLILNDADAAGIKIE